MKKIRLFLILFLQFLMFFTLTSMVFANDDNVVYFILQRANGYKTPNIASKSIKNVILNFRDVIKYTQKVKSNSITWYKCYLKGTVFYLPHAFIDEKRFKDFVLDQSGNIVIGTSRIDRIYSIPLNYVPSDLIPLSSSVKAKGYEWRKLRLRAEAKEMFEKMIKDAETSGMHISVISSFRDSAYQSMLYTRSIRSKGLNEKSVAKPGHSEHQLGTACDLTSDEIDYRLSSDFENTLAYKWLVENSWRYGIFLTYPRLKQRITGYIYEPWHFRYWGKDHWKNLFKRYGIMLR